MPEDDIDQQILNEMAAEEIVAERNPRPAPAKKEDDRLGRLEKMMESLVEGKRAAPPTDGYERERTSLIEDEKKILVAATKSNLPTFKIVACHGVSQLVLNQEHGGERLNGVIVVRSYVARLASQQNDAGKPVGNDVTESVVGEPWCEVWGYLEPNNREKIGALAMFPLSAVSCVVNLRSDMHVGPS